MTWDGILFLLVSGAIVAAVCTWIEFKFFRPSKEDAVRKNLQYLIKLLGKPCSVNTCDGCQYEMEETADTVKETLRILDGKLVPTEARAWEYEKK